MIRRLIIISVIIIAALCSLAGLGYHSIRMWSAGLEGARLGQFARAAETIRSDVKRKLDDFLQTEQNRPYTDYQYYYVPDEFAQQQQNAIVRSPLSGTLDNEFAYGNFQIDMIGNVITPNDDFLNNPVAEAVDAELSREVGLNRFNIENHLLPVLKTMETADSEPVEEPVPPVVVAAAEPEPPSKAKIESNPNTELEMVSKQALVGRGKSLPIESLTENQGTQTQVFRQSRAAVSNSSQMRGDYSNNRAFNEAQQQIAVGFDPNIQQQMYNGSPAQAADTQPQVSLRDQIAAVNDAPQVARPLEVPVAPPRTVSPTTVDAADSLTNQNDPNIPAPTSPEAHRVMSLNEEGENTDTVQTAEGPGGVGNMPQAGGRYGGGGYGGGYGGAGYGQGAQPQSQMYNSDQYAQTIRMAIPQTEQSATPMMAPQEDTVEVRVEPFSPIVIPETNGQSSVFNGQVFLVRHVTIEDEKLIQGFQLNEQKLVEEVRESAQRITGLQSGMGFELPQVDEDNGVPESENVSYTALLDFGFGYLIVNLLEADPGRLTRQVAQLEYWYFGIIITVLLAVTLALTGLWRNAYAQVRLARKKDDFISAVSHELRTPLTSIRMYSEMLEKNWVKSPEKLGEYYKNMRQESERLSRLIENVLDFSRIQRGKKKYAFRVGDINRCVTDVIEMMRPYASQAGFEIETHLAELDQTAFDPDAVTQIVVNLLDNAIKYARNAADKTIIVRTARTDGSVIIEIEDHGPGIPARLRKKVFEEFYRLGPEATRETTGTGLGLALVRKFAQAHQGFVEILSAKPTGTVLRVGLSAQNG